MKRGNGHAQENAVSVYFKGNGQKRTARGRWLGLFSWNRFLRNGNPAVWPQNRRGKELPAASCLMAAAGTAAAAAAGRAAAAVAAARQGDFGFNHKPHIGQVDGHRADLFGQFLVDAERQAVVLGRFIVLAGFVKGEGQAGAAASAGGKVHPDGGLFLAFKIRFKLFASLFGKRDHQVLQRSLIRRFQSFDKGFLRLLSGLVKIGGSGSTPLGGKAVLPDTRACYRPSLRRPEWG